MGRSPSKELRRGWTTGACATAATQAALRHLWTGVWPAEARLVLPRGEAPCFAVAHRDAGAGWSEAGIVKDAGDDPDVTHGALILARVTAGTGGVRFHAGEGVGTVTRPGLPIAVGEAAINPVPRRMMTAEVEAIAAELGRAPDIDITVSVPDGARIARDTWNPRLGIAGGLSILGTTGVVRPFSCAAWIASIHRGIDVARAAGLSHVAGTTGAQSERAVQALHGLPDHAMLDMGDFAGGMVKYLTRHPVGHLTLGGGVAKLAKLGQGARDLHSARNRVDFDRLAAELGRPEVAGCNTVLEALERVGPELSRHVARTARAELEAMIADAPITVDVVVCDRSGAILARA